MIPKTITVLGKKYKVRFRKDGDMPDADGLMDPTDHTISLNKSIATNKKLLQVFLHEVGHSIFKEASLDVSISPDIEEVVVDLFSRIFTDYFDDWIGGLDECEDN